MFRDLRMFAKLLEVYKAAELKPYPAVGLSIGAFGEMQERCKSPAPSPSVAMSIPLSFALVVVLANSNPAKILATSISYSSNPNSCSAL